MERPCRTRRVAIPDLGHLLNHELDGPRVMHGFEIDDLTTGREVATEKHLADLPGRLAAALVELPLRDAGCLLPAWEDLVALSASAGARNIRLHFDGARIWEAQPFYDRPLAEIAGLADSIYVSFDKGSAGSPAPACAVRKTSSTSLAAGASGWAAPSSGGHPGLLLARWSAGVLVAVYGVVRPVGLGAAPPRSVVVDGLLSTSREWPDAVNTFEMYAEGEVDAVNDRLIAFMTEHRLALTNPWRATDVPGRIGCESAIGDGALGLDPAKIAAWIGELVSPG